MPDTGGGTFGATYVLLEPSSCNLPLGLLPSKHLASPDVLWATFTFLEMNKEIVSNRSIGNNDFYKTLGIFGNTSPDFS